MTMYGTVARMRVKPDHDKQLQAMQDEWTQERGRRIEGYVASYVLRPDQHPDEVILVAIFRDRESYRANASDPEQDRWYRRMREHLAADPEWTDGELVFASTADG
ncbi:MAG TPA: antibiotic biosynthesis monooxygenase [Chloroflexota bacterium]|jgi:quinol monooxygenase YgiN|nr:antibiotic biosynthesis monooxygenase [Chloroflexota bacterium]